MYQFSPNGEGHITKSRSEMNTDELNAAYEALLLDKMQVADQKDRLFDENAELRFMLDEVTNVPEGTQEFKMSHGAHFVAIEARKLLAKLGKKA